MILTNHPHFLAFPIVSRSSIFVFNFFPSSQANAHLSLEQNIISKLQSFYNTLGEDSKYLSDEEQVTSYNLYERLNSKDTFDTDGNIQNW